MSFTTERIVRTEGHSYSANTWYECPGCACVLPGKKTMDFHRTYVARCQRLDVNAKPFVPWSEIRAYHNEKRWLKNGVWTKGPKYENEVEKHLELRRLICDKELYALSKYLS